MKTSKIVLFSIISLFVASFFLSCGNKGPKVRIKYTPEVSDLKADIKILRFEQDLLAIDTANISEDLEKLKEKYGDFVKNFLVDVLNDGKALPIADIARTFLSIPETRQLADSIRKAYPDMQFAKQDIENLLRYKQHYFGEKEMPIKKVYTVHTLYKYGAFTYDDIACLGLDFFLGENHIGYMAVENLNPMYKRRTLSKEHLVATLGAAMAENIVNENSKQGGNRMIDFMIQEGKKFFVKACLLPTSPDSIIYNFSNFQVLYCQNGEVSLWSHLGKENLLFSSKKNDFQKYTFEGPFNPQANLPGNSGSWLGTQIIMQYADKMRKELKALQPAMSAREIDRKVMQQVLQENDSQKFIKKYKPTM